MRDDTITPKVFILCLMAILGVVVWGFIENFFKDPSVDFDTGGVSEVVSVDGLALVPGKEREFSFQLKCRDSGEYQVGLMLTEKADGGLKPFVNVQVELDGKTILNGNLEEIMGSSAIVLDEYEFSRESVDLVITYMMPAEIGNEAMGTSADFDMHILIAGKGDVVDE